MFGKKNRYSFKRGVPKQIFATHFFVLRYQQPSQVGFTCAVVVGKKVDKRAVIRNKIKRKIVEEIQKLSKEQPINSEMVLFAKKDIIKLENAQISEELRKTFITTHIHS